MSVTPWSVRNRRSTRSLALTVLFSASALLFIGEGLAAPISVTVPGIGDLWLAGRPGGFTTGSDVVPLNAPVLAAAGSALTGLASLTFTGISGTTGGYGASGGAEGTFDFSPSSVNSISGLVSIPAGALLGLFLDASLPSGASPASLNFSGANKSFTSLSPLLSQVFFIGDGLTGSGSGSIQNFVVPTGATRLFLGIADTPGTYFNNFGSLTITIDGLAGTPAAAVPEPSTGILFGFALGAMLMLRRARRT